MFKVRIINEFIHSPIWIYGKDSIVDEPPIIANDEVLQNLCNKVENMFSSYYEFNSHDVPCWFNYDKEKAEKGKMLDLINRIKKRLNEINDGGFTIEDFETERLKNL